MLNSRRRDAYRVHLRVLFGHLLGTLPQLLLGNHLLCDIWLDGDGEVARKDLEKRLLEVRVSETKKMKKPRQELDQLILDYEEKLRVLNLRIQASEVIQSETTDVT